MSASSAFARFPPRLQQAIATRLHWKSLREVQEEASHAILDGKNAVILAPTAGGKTEASMFPVLAEMIDNPGDTDAVKAIYVAPIKALLNNQAERLGLYTEMVGRRRFLWHGDVTTSQRKQFIKDPADLLMTTPESLEVMLASQKVPAAKLFDDLRFVVVDEIHAMAGVDRGAHLMSVIERIAILSKNDVQRIGLSATVGNPEAILEWLKGSSARDGVVVDPPKKAAKRRIQVHLDADLASLADRSAAAAKGKKSLFFCESRALTEGIAERLRDRGTDVFVHHSSVSLEERELAEERFHRGADAAIVCTSTLELGIDVGDLDLVFQTNTPSTVGSFLQRMGRTGRRADTDPTSVANTTFYCDEPESVLNAVAIVELAKQNWVESIEPQTRCWPVLVHQTLALCLSTGAIARSKLWEVVSRIPDFADIRREDFEELMDYMVRRNYLYETSGMLAMGDRAERVYGRRHFIELYAVFSSPVHYRVLTATGRDIGYLEQAFVDGLVEEMTSFLLGGRAWLVSQVNHKHKTVEVEAAPRGKMPSWGGFAPKLLGFEICQQVRRTLLSIEAFPYLSERAEATLEGYREEFSALLARSAESVQYEASRARWWTFAGGKINQTLKYAITALEGWKVVADNWMLRIEGDGVTPSSFDALLARLCGPAFWQDDDTWARIIALVPPYRLSKFQEALPSKFQQEMLGRYLLDIQATKAFLMGESVSSQDKDLLERALARVEAQAAESGVFAQPENEIEFVETDAELVALCKELLKESRVGLDVETTLIDRELCTVQLATETKNYIVDALAVSSISPLAKLLTSRDVLKLVHFADFERSVFSKYSIHLEHIYDTHAASSRIRGRRAKGGHSLAAVCDRELGKQLDKTHQTADWTVRPLPEAQLNYAALDAEVLLQLHDKFESEKGAANA